ncbi:MAG: hypothetical protein JSV01_00380 [Desulfobacterales bacterium]|nr:MAG: hypothetical protein JSV01_00380 [Desulfobacterales bacterium]
MRMFILAVVLIVPVFLFNVSCEKEQPVSEESALEHPVPEPVGIEPQPAEVEEDVAMDEAVEEGEGEDVGHEVVEEEGEGEDVGHEAVEEEGEPEE